MIIRSTLAAGLAVGLSASALAQSNVTVYGRIDMGLEMVQRSGGDAPSDSSGRMFTDTSYWGLRGSEDMGDGMKAYFKLESGFNPNDGRGGAIFNRESYLGLSGRLGSLQAGHQFAPAVTLTGRLDPFQRSMNGLIQNLMQTNAGNAQRGTFSQRQNAVQYISPTMQGFTVRALYAFSEQFAEPRALNRSRALGLEYANGPLYSAFSYESSEIATVPAGGTRRNDTYLGGLTYDFEVVKLHGLYMRNNLEHAPGAHGFMVGASAPFAGGTVRASYTWRTLRGEDGQDASVAALGYTYPLSKRTMVYTSLAYLDNGRQARYALWPSSKAASLSAPGQDVRSLQVGMRHMF